MKTLLVLCAAFTIVISAPHQNEKTDLRISDIISERNAEKQLTSTNPFDEFAFAADLDVAGKYWLFWTPDDETQTITFEVHVEALGYVGFGLSPNGGMTGADVVIGWVLEDGTAVFHDRHALGEYEPVIDNSQDVTLLAATQNDTHTILRFSRPYVTCDGDDRDVTADTTRVIYSFTDTDPEDITGLSYHGSVNRGTKSVVLINYNDGDQTLPEDSVSMDFVVSEIEVPRKRTTYWCEFKKIPQRPNKHHVVMFEPVVKPGNEGIVHHIVVYACYGEMEEEDHGVAWDCIYNVMPRQNQCISTMFVWAVGGNAVYFPENTGIPFFSPEDQAPTYVRIEMHYDNPSNIEGITDDSGIRIHMTPTLREFDAGTMMIGSAVGSHMLLPPKFDALTYRGHCKPECLQNGIDRTDENPDNDAMKVFAVYQHSHLLGRKMKTRVYRDDKEIEPLATDENYDFNFQETRLLKRERYILPTDTLVVDCEYDSSASDIITEGGLATVNEMCVSFMYYYPRNNISMCTTNPPEYNYVRAVEELEMRFNPIYPHYEITGPPEYVGMTTKQVLETVDWNDPVIKERFQNLLLETNVNIHNSCTLGNEQVASYWVKAPELGEDWVDPDDGQCNVSRQKPTRNA